jgi:hypothetical protein
MEGQICANGVYGALSSHLQRGISGKWLVTWWQVIAPDIYSMQITIAWTNSLMSLGYLSGSANLYTSTNQTLFTGSTSTIAWCQTSYQTTSFSWFTMTGPIYTGPSSVYISRNLTPRQTIAWVRLCLGNTFCTQTQSTVSYLMQSCRRDGLCSPVAIFAIDARTASMTHKRCLRYEPSGRFSSCELRSNE